jgi:hypothetical protein
MDKSDFNVSDNCVFLLSFPKPLNVTTPLKTVGIERFLVRGIKISGCRREKRTNG